MDTVEVVGAIGQKASNIYNLEVFSVKDRFINVKVAGDLGVLVNVFLLAYSDILILGSELFRVGGDSTGGIT